MRLDITRGASLDEIVAEMDRRGRVLDANAEYIDRLKAVNKDCEREITRLRAENERLESALRFYADQNNYEGRGDIWGDGPVYPPLVFEDKGGRARAALKDKSNEPREAMAALNAARLEAHQR